MNATTDGARRLITEEIPVASSELIERVRGLLAEGTVRHIKVKSPNGEVYFEVPLAIGLLGGAALAWASPWLAMAGALAGLVTSVKLEVAREPRPGDVVEAHAKAEADKAWHAVTAGGARRPSPPSAKRPAKRVAAPAKAAPKRGAASTAPTKRPAAAPAKKPRAGAKSAPRGKTSKTTGRR